MDEVAIPNNNPIKPKPIVEKINKPKKNSKLFDTFKNFIFMFPLAAIISYQLYLLGYRFGEFITFPPISVISYIFIGSILLMLLVIQILMRSIIYSIMVGIFFLAGICSAWFGNVTDPVFNNLTSIIEIVKSAWTRKDIPYQLVVTGTITSLFFGIITLQFLVSILVKSFFELVFGKNWGDGKLYGYLGAIAIILGIHISFNSYHKFSNDNKEKLLWKSYQCYEPMEKFITRTPGSVTYNDEYIWVNNGQKIDAFDINNGKLWGTQKIKSKVVCKDIEKSEYPVIGTDNKFICYDTTLYNVRWETLYPVKTASDTPLDTASNSKTVEPLIPLTVKYINNGNYLLAFYDYGMIGLYDMDKGKELWCQTIDKAKKISRILPDKYLNDISYLVNKEKVIISCSNGLIKSIDIKSGKIDWIYEHSISKIGGKPQKGYLSKNNDNSFVAAFKTGEIVTLSYKDGHIIQRSINEAFVANSPVWCNDRKAHFITDEGLFYQVKLDAGEVDCRLNAIPNKTEFYPIIQNNEHGIYAHRENIYKIGIEQNYTKLIFSCKNRTFITNPVFDKKVMYIGTLDGWIFCLHYGSENVKWVGHVDGQLMEDSLALINDKLIVKTKSDSVFVYNRLFVQ